MSAVNSRMFFSVWLHHHLCVAHPCHLDSTSWISGSEWSTLFKFVIQYYKLIWVQNLYETWLWRLSVFSILLTISWSGHLDLSHSNRASFRKAAMVPPWLLWTAAMVAAFLTISIIPVKQKLDELHYLSFTLCLWITFPHPLPCCDD